jgi:hypothetical protein
MPIFVVVPLRKETAPLNAAVERYIADPNDRYHLQADSGWLIKFSGTAAELSNHLTLTGQLPGTPAPIPSGLVVLVAGYFGRGPTDMWEWIKTRLEQQQ